MRIGGEAAILAAVGHIVSDQRRGPRGPGGRSQEGVAMVTQQVPPAVSSLALDDDAVQAFRASVRGKVIRQGDDGYDAARQVWNGMIQKSPALIVRCGGVADVLRAVEFARAQQLLVAVRSGGHNVAGNAVCDRGMVIDL